MQRGGCRAKGVGFRPRGVITTTPDASQADLGYISRDRAEALRHNAHMRGPISRHGRCNRWSPPHPTPPPPSRVAPTTAPSHTPPPPSPLRKNRFLRVLSFRSSRTFTDNLLFWITRFLLASFSLPSLGRVLLSSSFALCRSRTWTARGTSEQLSYLFSEFVHPELKFSVPSRNIVR